MIDFLSFSRITDCIEFHYKNNPNKHLISIYSKGEKLSFSRKDFWDKVLNYEKLFSNLVENKSLILFIKELDIELMSAYIGAIKSGNIPALISPISIKISEEEYKRKIYNILNLTHSKYLLTDNKNKYLKGNHISFNHEAELQDILKKDKFIENICIITPESDYIENKSNLNEDNEIALVQFSSGTTGLQKGVKISHSALLNHMQDYQEFVPITNDLKFISWLPLYHDLGLISSFLYPLMSGSEIFQLNPFEWILNPSYLLEIIEKEKITTCSMPNFAFNLLTKKSKEYDLSSMKLFCNCSEPVFYSTINSFEDKFKTLNKNVIRSGYGLAENTMAVCMCKSGKNYKNKIIHGKTVLSCGDLMKNTQVKIFNPDQEGVGEIGIKSPYIFSGFMGKEPEMLDGFYLTGDLGLVEDNILYISGRKKDIIIVNGRNIYPQDVENLVSEIEGIYTGRCVAIGIENEETGSEELYILAETKGQIDKIKLKISINKILELELGIVPKKIEFIESKTLVKTSSGKLSRSRNKELYLAKELKII